MRLINIALRKLYTLEAQCINRFSNFYYTTPYRDECILSSLVMILVFLNHLQEEIVLLTFLHKDILVI